MTEDTLLYKGKNLGPRADVSGQLKSIPNINFIDKIDENDIAYIPHSDSSEENVVLFYQLVKSGVSAIICERLERTDHGVLLTNELGVPCVSDVPPSLAEQEGNIISVRKEEIYLGNHAKSEITKNRFDEFSFPDTKTDIKANIGFPEVIETRPELPQITTGVGFLRLEFLLLDILNNTHPKKFIIQYGRNNLITKLADRIEPVLSVYDEPVWIRTNDFSVPQLRQMKDGTQYEQQENNSMLGWRGISRSNEDSTLYEIELEAVKILVEKGYDNIGIFPPMTRFSSEYVTWKKKALELGLDDITFGVMVETPSTALTFENFTEDVEFVVFGSNDLTQFTLAIDRNNQRLQTKFDEKSESVLKLFKRVIDISIDNNIETCIGGQAASDPNLATELISYGIDSLSVNPDYETISSIRTHLSNTKQNN